MAEREPTSTTENKGGKESLFLLLLVENKKKKVKRLCFSLYSTPAKAWKSVDVVESGPYMWNSYEQGRRNVGYKILSLACAKGVTALGRK